MTRSIVAAMLIVLPTFLMLAGLAWRDRRDCAQDREADARSVTKPRVRISQDGWIRNTEGRFPFDPSCHVELVFDDASPLLAPHTARADYWHESWWKREAYMPGRNIAFYRISRLPVICTTPPRISR